ncbi:MAG: class I SAM-dependent methyltransferase [Chloroflexia bacterium]
MSNSADLDRFARFYDLEYSDYDADLRFFREYAGQVAGFREHARILEPACGSGRVLTALAEDGHLCTGLDASLAMLALARRRAADAGLADKIRLVEGRMEALPDGLGSFDLALCALNSFGYLATQAEQIAALEGIHGVTAPGGWLLLDLSPVGADGPFPASGEMIHQGSWPRQGGGEVSKFVTGTWDSAEQQQHVRWIYDETDAEGRLTRTVIPQTIRYTHRWEVQLLLERTGFRLTELYGSYLFSGYSAESERMIIVAERE